MLHHDGITLRTARDDEAESLHELITRDEEWTRYNGPYFPYEAPTLERFRERQFQRWRTGERGLLIEHEGEVVGSVSCYWECESTRWLEAGVAIYDSSKWGQRIGRRALVPWVTHLFETLTIERVGLTTWSGNPRMMACALGLGFTQEARLRKVRFHEGVYYDSVKYGVLREEWFAARAQSE